jgi:uncharacterized lipoprotein NlpE involved in copper resistance
MKQLMIGLMAVFAVMILGCRNESDKNAVSIKVVTERDLNSSVISPFGNQPSITVSTDEVIGITFGSEETIYFISRRRYKYCFYAG